MNLRKRLGGSSAQRGFFSLFLSTSLGSLLALALSPVITRLFDPSSFGSFTLLTAVAMILAPLLSVRLELAVPLPEKDSSSYAVAHAGIASSLLLGSVLSAFFYFTGPFLGSALGQPTAGAWLWTTPLMASAMSIFSILNALAVRGARYKAIARRNILMTSTTLGGQIIAGGLGFGLGGLVIGFTLGQAIGTVSMLFGSGLRGPEALDGRSLKRVLATLSRYRHVPSFLALAGILSALGLQAPVLLLSHFYSGEVVGWFGLTQRVLAAPLTLIGLSVAQVYLSEIARSRRNIAGDEQRLFWRATRALSALGAVLAVGLLAVGPQVFDVLFGGAWKVSGEFARILAIALAAQLIASPLSQTLIVFERSRLQLLWDASRLLLVSGSVAATATWGSSVHFTVGALCASLTAMYALQWELSRRTLAGNRAKGN